MVDIKQPEDSTWDTVDNGIKTDASEKLLPYSVKLQKEPTAARAEKRETLQDSQDYVLTETISKAIEAWSEISWPAKLGETDIESLKNILLRLKNEGEEEKKGKGSLQRLASKTGAKTAAALTETRRRLKDFMTVAEKRTPALGGQAATTASEVLGAVPIVGSLAAIG